MKNFPAIIEGSKGIWYKKVNEIIAEASKIKKLSDLVALLGEPDRIEDETNSPQNELKQSGFDSSFDQFQPTNAERIVVYQNPYKKAVSYHFAVKKGKVTNFWEQSVGS